MPHAILYEFGSVYKVVYFRTHHDKLSLYPLWRTFILTMHESTCEKEVSFPRPETDGLEGIIARARSISFVSIRKRCEEFVTIRIMCYFRLNAIFTSRFVYLVLSCCICFYDDVTKWKCCPHIIGYLWREPRVTGGCPWKLSACNAECAFFAVTLNTFI